MLHFAIFSFSRNKIINKLCKQKIINLNLIIFSLIFKLGFNHINNKNLKNRMTHSLDYSLYQIEEKESLNCSKNEIEHNNSFDPNLDNKINEIKIFNEIKKVLNFNEPNYDCKDINDEERYFICKDKMKDLNKNNLIIKEVSSQINPLMIKVDITKITKRGRKLKISNEIGNHNKKSFDNLLRRLKHSLLKGLIIFINIKIKETHEDDKKQLPPKILTLDQKDANNSSIAFHKKFIYKSIKEIFSAKLTTKYKSKKDNLEIYNEDLINKLLSEKNILKRNIFESILNLKFIDVINYIIGKRNDLTQLYGLKLTDNLLEDMSIDEEYSEKIFDIMRNLEKILNEKKPRNRSKKINLINKKN